MELPIYTRDAEAETPFNQAFGDFFNVERRYSSPYKRKNLNS